MAERCTACSSPAVKGTLCMRCHRKFLGALKDIDKNPYAQKLMQPVCTCCPIHKGLIEKVDALIEALRK